MFSIYITKKSIVLQHSQQTLLQQDCRVTFSGSSGSSFERKSQAVYMQSYLCFFFFFYIIKQKGKMKDEAQLAQFLCFIPTFQEIYRVTGTVPDIGVRQKPPYRCSGLRFSGSGFSGSFVIFLVLGLLVIDGFDSSARFAGFSFLVNLVLALLVLGGSFSGSSFLALLLKEIASFQHTDAILSFSLFSLFLYSNNHHQRKSHEYNTYNKKHQPFFLAQQSPQPLHLYLPSRNVYYYSNNNNNKHYTTEKKQRKVQEARCYVDATTRGKWLFSSGVWNN